MAARPLAALPAGVRTRPVAIADALIMRRDEILEANARDLEAGREADIGSALLDRLTLTPERIAAMAEGVRQVAALPDPVGEVLDGGRLDNGLQVERVRVPLGVVAVVYEARPNVTIDAAALALKSGNAIVLRGSSTAQHSNAILASVAAQAAESAGVPAGAIALVSGGGREELAELATQEGVVDLIIPRGGEGLKAALKGVATVPVIFAASGVCHVYVDASADLERARAIILNAKTQRPGVCNAAETLLVHSSVAAAFLPEALRALAGAGVELRVDARARAAAGEGAPPLVDAVPEDWDTEYLDLILSVGVVDSVEEAVDHVVAHGSGHSDAILTDDLAAPARSWRGDSAAVRQRPPASRRGRVRHGARSHSTQKLHARARSACASCAPPVRRPGRRARPSVTVPWRPSASSAGPSTRRTSGTCSAPRRRAIAWAWTASC